MEYFNFVRQKMMKAVDVTEANAVEFLPPVPTFRLIYDFERGCGKTPTMAIAEALLIAKSVGLRTR